MRKIILPSYNILVHIAIFFIILILVLLFLFPFMKGMNLQANDLTSSTPSNSSKSEIVIAVMGPLTGGAALYGINIKIGVEQAAKEINAAGGILGQKIKIILGDDAGDPKQGVSVANKFVGENVNFVVGTPHSSVTEATSPVHADHNILHIATSSTAVGLTERGLWNLFRMCGRDDQQARAAALYLAEHYPGKKIAFLHDKSTFGKGLADNVRKEIQASAKMDIVLYEGINLGEKDYLSIISKVKEVQADVLYWGGLAAEGALLVRQMRDQGMNTLFVGGDTLTSDDFPALAGKAVEGTLISYEQDVRQLPEAATTIAKFKEQKISIDAFMLHAYAAVQVIQQAAEATHSFDPHKIADFLHSGAPVQTIMGTLRYNSKGDVMNPLYKMYQWHRGEDGRLAYQGIE